MLRTATRNDTRPAQMLRRYVTEPTDFVGDSRRGWATPEQHHAAPGRASWRARCRAVAATGSRRSAAAGSGPPAPPATGSGESAATGSGESAATGSGEERQPRVPPGGRAQPRVPPAHSKPARIAASPKRRSAPPSLPRAVPHGVLSDLRTCFLPRVSPARPGSGAGSVAGSFVCENLKKVLPRLVPVV